MTFLKLWAGSQKLLLHFWFAESLTNLSSDFLSCSTVYFWFSVIAVEIVIKIYSIFVKKPNVAVFWKFLSGLETLKTWIVLILKIVTFQCLHFECQLSRNLGDSQTFKFWLKNLKVKHGPTPWPILCLKWPVYCVFNGIIVIQIHPKMAKKARCQFPWPLLWPWFLHRSKPSAIYEQLFTTAEKVVFPLFIGYIAK